MIKKLKDFLGIEGVRLQAEVRTKDDFLQGSVSLASPTKAKVESLHFKLEENYRRGRFKQKRVDTYLLAQLVEKVDISLESQTPYEYAFELPFDRLQAPIDRLAEQNLVLRGLVEVAKTVKGAKSELWLTITAKVKGTRLNPFVRIKVSD